MTTIRTIQTIEEELKDVKKKLEDVEKEISEYKIKNPGKNLKFILNRYFDLFLYISIYLKIGENWTKTSFTFNRFKIKKTRFEMKKTCL